MMGASRRKSGRGRARPALLGAVLAVAGIVGMGYAPAPASAQLRAAGQASFANDVLGGTIGVGPRAEFGVPAFPVRLAASADYFFPSCNQCRYWEANVNALVALPLLPIPFFRYFGGGFHLQSIKANPFDEATRARGINAVAGLRADNTNIEVRYEILDDIPNQFVFSFAIFFL